MAEAWSLGTAGSPLHSPGLFGGPWRLCLSSLWGRVEWGNRQLWSQPSEGSWSPHSQDQPVAATETPRREKVGSPHVDGLLGAMQAMVGGLMPLSLGWERQIVLLVGLWEGQ